MQYVLNNNEGNKIYTLLDILNDLIILYSSKHFKGSLEAFFAFLSYLVII